MKWGPSRVKYNRALCHSGPLGLPIKTSLASLCWCSLVGITIRNKDLYILCPFPLTHQYAFRPDVLIYYFPVFVLSDPWPVSQAIHHCPRVHIHPTVPKNGDNPGHCLQFCPLGGFPSITVLRGPPEVVLWDGSNPSMASAKIVSQEALSAQSHLHYLSLCSFHVNQQQHMESFPGVEFHQLLLLPHRSHFQVKKILSF